MNTALLERPHAETTYRDSLFNGMVVGMATKKYTVTLPEELAEEIRTAVGPGRFSAFIATVLEHQMEIDRLGKLVDRLEDEYGEITDEELAAIDERRRKREAEHAASLVDVRPATPLIASDTAIRTSVVRSTTVSIWAACSSKKRVRWMAIRALAAPTSDQRGRYHAVV